MRPTLALCLGLLGDAHTIHGLTALVVIEFVVPPVPMTSISVGWAAELVVQADLRTVTRRSSGLFGRTERVFEAGENPEVRILLRWVHTEGADDPVYDVILASGTRGDRVWTGGRYGMARRVAVRLARALDAPLTDDGRPSEGRRSAADLVTPRVLVLPVLDAATDPKSPPLCAASTCAELPGWGRGPRMVVLLWGLAWLLLVPMGALAPPIGAPLAGAWCLLSAVPVAVVARGLRHRFGRPVSVRAHQGILAVTWHGMFTESEEVAMDEVEQVVILDDMGGVRVVAIDADWCLGAGLSPVACHQLAAWLAEHLPRPAA